MLDSNTVELVIAFPGGKGTSDMINRARKSGIEVKEIQNEQTTKSIKGWCRSFQNDI